MHSLPCPALLHSPILLHSVSPCSLTLGANSCSLINYWCSKAVVGLAGSGFQWVDVGVFNGQCSSQAPLWGASGHPHGSSKDTNFHARLLVCMSGARLTLEVTVVSIHHSIQLASNSDCVLIVVITGRDRMPMRIHRVFFKMQMFHIVLLLMEDICKWEWHGAITPKWSENGKRMSISSILFNSLMYIVPNHNK